MKEALKLALEALEECRRDPRLKYEHPTYDKTITAIKEALANHIEDNLAMVAQPEQEPVAFICQGNVYMADDVDKYCTAKHIPLYTKEQL